MLLWPSDPIEKQAEKLLLELKAGDGSNLWPILADEEKEENPGLTSNGVQLIVSEILQPAVLAVESHPRCMLSTQSFDKLGYEHQGTSSFSAVLDKGGEMSVGVNVVRMRGRRTVSLTDMIRQAWMSRGAKQRGVPFDRKSFHLAMARGWAQDKAVLERAGFTNLVFIDHGTASITVRDWESHKQVIDQKWPDWANEPVPSI